MDTPQYVNIKDSVDLVRDTHSMGILNTNAHALEEAKRRHREAMAKLAEERRKEMELNTLRKEVNELKDLFRAEVCELKNVIRQLLEEKR